MPKLDLNVITEIVHNELTPLCTHVLPTKDPVERAEITRWDTLSWNVSVQYTPPLVEPLVLTSRRQVKKLNAQLGFMGEPADLLLHPDTAAAHGIADGQRVRVYTKRGEIVLTAKVNPGMRKGVCSIPHGHLDANVNNLTSTGDVDPLGGMALYSGVPIQIEPVT